MENPLRFTKKLILTCSAAALLFTVNAQPPPTPKKDPVKQDAMKAAPSTPTAPVDINNATQSELEAVKGIGPATAKKIIAGRPYTAVSDLAKAGLQKAQVQTLTPFLKVGPAPASKTAKAAATPTAAAAPGGSAGKVWVNKESKVFHREGNRWYGKTKEGAYMTEAEALKAGYREAKDVTEKKK